MVVVTMVIISHRIMPCCRPSVVVMLEGVIWSHKGWSCVSLESDDDEREQDKGKTKKNWEVAGAPLVWVSVTTLFVYADVEVLLYVLFRGKWKS